MLERAVTIRNRRGLHARAAAKVVTLSERFDVEISVGYDDQVVPAASIMGLMMLGAAAGATLLLRAEGADAEAALEALVHLIDSGFNESE